LVADSDVLTDTIALLDPRNLPKTSERITSQIVGLVENRR